jgi:hypothetical protein
MQYAMKIVSASSAMPFRRLHDGSSSVVIVEGHS